jgi:hypothetical protein
MSEMIKFLNSINLMYYRIKYLKLSSPEFSTAKYIYLSFTLHTIIHFTFFIYCVMYIVRYYYNILIPMKRR